MLFDALLEALAESPEPPPNMMVNLVCAKQAGGEIECPDVSGMTLIVDSNNDACIVVGTRPVPVECDERFDDAYYNGLPYTG